jgi:hypothetical protein
MVDVQAIGQIFSVESAAWAFVAILFVSAFKVYPLVMERLNERHRDRQNGVGRHQDRLEARIVRLEGRCDNLENELIECHRERDEWRGRAIAAEAVMLGTGTAKQEAQRIVSTERERDAAKRRGE